MSLIFFKYFTYKWYHTVFVWPTSFSMMPSRFIHVVKNGIFFSFSWLNNFPLCVCVCMCVFVYMFFIQSSADRYLDCFNILAIVSMLKWIGGYRYLFCILFSFFRYISRSRITASYGSSVFISLEKSILFSIVAMPI